ncbi:integumentary mucin C.1 [Folsomia candida]|uniref:Uncharacterized protein n=1 Tax=Folsomia candida TaxID=158441 RepID=A0A226D1S6_FOLCA|nr:integumentary mucin C.1 [Folsomia candida]OXA39123.1 hypothetical protein Fcan01_26130 [Folsomia candida]
MKTIIAVGLAICVLALVADSFAHSGEDDAKDGRLCRTAGETILTTKPDGYSKSCVCQAPTTTTTSATTTSTTRPTRRPRPAKNTWKCTTTKATTTSTTTTALP